MRAGPVSSFDLVEPSSSLASLCAYGGAPLPNFFIIGASRSGTTTLHYMLAQHPQIYMSPVKETNFFAVHCSDGAVPRCTRLEEVAGVDRRSVKDVDEYRLLFAGASDEIAIGETSPSYLLTAGVPEAIRSVIPQAKIIAVLRQPVDKAYSHFFRRVPSIYSRDSDFVSVLEQDEARVRGEGRGTSFLSQGFYHDRLKRFYDVFERDRIRICLFDDMKTRPEEFYADLFRHLGVDERFQGDFSARFNQTGNPKNRLIARLTCIGKPLRRQLNRYLPTALVAHLARWQHIVESANLERPPALSPDLRRTLTERYYVEDIEKLQVLIGRDLSHWLK
ncbi:MAG: sulfotransferase family protein [Kiloniellales bacterium]